jgi:hypothetical protein
MPTKKRIARTKKAGAKKRPSKKPGKRKRFISQSIGIVTSITFSGTQLETSFKRGLNMPNVPITILPLKPSYDNVALSGAVTTFNSDGTGLIVTVGGLVSAIAAQVGAHKPWICLVGGTPGSFPQSPGGNFYGGISLESYEHHGAHVNHQHSGHNIQVQDICLLNNPASTMAPTELQKWNALGAAPPVPAGWNGKRNDAATYPGAFARIPPNVRAVVVSADPFFQQTMDDLIDAANNWSAPARRVSYPLQSYANVGGHTQPLPQHHTLQGPDLEQAYQDLGAKAAAILANGLPSTLDRMGPGTPHDR